MYRPKEPFNVCAELYNPTTVMSHGVSVKTFSKVDSINCSFKSYGGTDSVTNNVLTVIDTAQVVTWYRPDITSASQLHIGAKVYEVVGEPEDIELRHQFLQLKVRSIKGGA